MADAEFRPVLTYLTVTEPYCGEAGTLRVLGQDGMPFPVQRLFWMTGIPTSATRGDHAHKKDVQVHVAIHRDWRITVEDRPGNAQQIILRSGEALLVPPMHWSAVRSCSQSGILAVLCAMPYNEADYYRDRIAWEAATRAVNS